MNKKAIYPGSFDPFTNGHLDMVKKAARLFQRVDILIGVNPSKSRAYSPEDMKRAIEKTLEKENIINCRVVILNGLVAQYTIDNDIKYMIRGLRNNMDYNYEENIAEINKLINPDLEYIYFRAENVAVSSSMVKELNLYHKNISKFVPEAVVEIMSGSEQNE